MIPSGLSLFTKFRKKKKEPVVEPKKGRKVIQVYKDGNIVGTYNDVMTACRILGLSKASVEMCLKGAQKFHKGYEFKEVEI